MENADKIFYQKKIIYLDYLEQENKIKNGGVIKWEARGQESRVQIHIRGLYPTDSLKGELQLLSWGNLYTAGYIYLRYGTGEYAEIWHNEDLAGTGISYENCDGIVIKLSGTRLLRGIWRNRTPREKIELVKDEKKTKTAETEEVIRKQEDPEENVNTGKQEDPEENVNTGKQEDPEENVNTGKQEDPEENVNTGDREDPEESSNAGEPVEPGKCVNAVETEEPAERRNGKESQELRKAEKTIDEPVVLLPDKWEQLNRIYSKIRPFGDVREYLSIAPRDFIILSEHYQELVQNSFLLHGYYNYGHLILTKIREGIEENYYLGVPGVYYEREKQAALLFGFEGFEGDGEAVTDGSFGYYMKRVEI